MVNQIPGITRRVQPNVFTRIRTRQRVNAAAGGIRDVVIIGEGEREETLVLSASGGGADGVNPAYNGSNSPDGRHFLISKTNLIEGRSSILKNGIPLVVLEGSISTSPFDSRYGARVDALTGRVELQRAHIEDVGGDTSVLLYKPSAANVGNGTASVSSTSLVDTNAPSETWTARVSSIVVDSLGDPVPGEAILSVTGSVSGQIFDSNGSPVLWKSDGVFVDNGILNVAFSEGSAAFHVGDKFTIKIASGVLQEGDTLEARFIAEEDLNDPELFDTPGDLFAKHGDPSVANALSLGAQMAFENGAPRVMALQARPPVPRKTSQVLIAGYDALTGSGGATGNADVEDTIFPLSVGALPDADLAVALFLINSDGTETQLGLNKEAFYNSTYTSLAAAYSSFVTNVSLSNTYTVFQSPQVEDSGNDGYVTVLSATEIQFTSSTAAFAADRVDAGEGDIGKEIVILSPNTIAGTPPAYGRYTITEIGDGYGAVNTVKATGVISSPPAFPTLPAVGSGYSNVVWQIQDPSDLGTYVAITDDVATTQLDNTPAIKSGLRALYVDIKDSQFFDTNWALAYETMETVEVQFVVPLPNATYSNIFSGGKIHVEKMSNILNAKERVLLVGSMPGLTPNNLIGRDLAAVEDIGVLEGIQGDDPEEVLGGNIEDLADYNVEAAFGDSFRVVWMHPDQIVRNLSGTNTFLPGFYMAACLGGFLAGQTQISEPPTFKTLTGFNILRNKVYRNVTLDELAEAGVLVVQPVTGGGRMLHGLTTTSSNAAEEEEISIVGIRDFVARVLRNTMRPFVGKVNSATLLAEISAGVDKVLRSLVSQGLLTGVGAISVQRNPAEPRQVDISVEVAPAGPINWIFMDITVSL